MRFRLLSACLVCTLIACDSDTPAGSTDATTTSDSMSDGPATTAETDASATTETTPPNDTATNDTASTDTADTAVTGDVGEDSTSAIEDVGPEDIADTAPPSTFSSFTVKVTEAIGESPLTVYNDVQCSPFEPAYAATEDAAPFGTNYSIGCTLDLHAGVIKINVSALAPTAGASVTDSIPANAPPRLIASASRPGLYQASTGMTGFTARLQIDAFDADAKTGSGKLTITQEPVVGSVLRQLHIEGDWNAQW